MVGDCRGPRSKRREERLVTKTDGTGIVVVGVVPFKHCLLGAQWPSFVYRGVGDHLQGILYLHHWKCLVLT